ncbi:YycH family regulatory protein [Tenuibacillus multivorans]|uniref:Two-component signal transduction system YycFG, regulatory protein YycH n=1 Tax=Tenuibacillus multivorans TaxID=237069 RepID=A0A1G9W924_9BACI|nr:two-component system activity regulator YycH [Tenuibacillus multivorans]GEL76352.1 hypothetical protein TMU01_05870 [Tenuibacillus multivorans]SDM80773.1 Two-component signal transduction system YycFG, regulatory protein YycH [Tenuibacillus multivorans]
MKLEQIKSIVLFLLVSFSLLITLALWTYQPQFEELEPPDYLEQTKLNGVEKTLKELIYPEKVIFHNYNEHKQLTEKSDEISFYKEMLEWDFSTINPYLTSNENVINRYINWEEPLGWVHDNRTQTVEIKFPVDIPIDLIHQMFSIDSEGTTWGNQTFNKLFYHLSQSDQEVEVIFSSDQHSEVLMGKIQSSQTYQRIAGLLNSERLMVHMQRYNFGQHAIYLPNKEINMPNHALLTDSLSIETMKNVLFKNPSLVEQTLLDQNTYYTDGTRALSTEPVLRNDEYLEFVNPLSNENGYSSTEDIIANSIQFTNDHTGWTDDYKIDDIRDTMSMIKYRMYYDGYPIFDSNIDPSLTEMEQHWRSNGLYQLKRPLFKTSNTHFSSEEEYKTLPSGEMVFETLQRLNERISLELIEEVQLGYKLEIRSDISNVLILEPEWHIKYRNSWRPLSYFTDMLMNQGVE